MKKLHKKKEHVCKLETLSRNISVKRVTPIIKYQGKHPDSNAKISAHLNFSYHNFPDNSEIKEKLLSGEILPNDIIYMDKDNRAFRLFVVNYFVRNDDLNTILELYQKNILLPEHIVSCFSIEESCYFIKPKMFSLLCHIAESKYKNDFIAKFGFMKIPHGLTTKMKRCDIPSFLFANYMTSFNGNDKIFLHMFITSVYYGIGIHERNVLSIPYTFVFQFPNAHKEKNKKGVLATILSYVTKIERKKIINILNNTDPGPVPSLFEDFYKNRNLVVIKDENGIPIIDIQATLSQMKQEYKPKTQLLF